MGDQMTKPTPDVSGLKWVRTLWGGLEPRWTFEPDITAVRGVVKRTLGFQGPCSVEFLAQGAFNKLYVVKHADEEVVARVTLPVDPEWKTLSEVATLRWVRENTSLPVPSVLSYSANRTNPIRFEWIIMNKIAGKPLADVWKDVPFSAKEQLVREIAKFCSDTFAHQFRGIGSIFPRTTAAQNRGDHNTVPKNNTRIDDDNDEPPIAPGFTVQRLVSSAFFDENPQPNVSRGPFASSGEWLSARLNLTELQCIERLKRRRKAAAESMDEEDGEDDEDEDEDDEDEEELEKIMGVVQRLRRHLADFFPARGAEPEPTVLFHDDMNSHNILVDEKGNLTAVVDWECVSALPLHVACEYPPFIQSKPNDVEPIKSIYKHDENGEVAELFWEHLEHYEKTQLRRIFLAEMETLQPDWVATYRSSERQRDFDLAVASCDDGFMTQRIIRWLDNLESGVEGVRGLQYRIDNALF